MSRQRLAGLCGPRHTWEESDQEKSRSIYSEAVSEFGPYRSNFYHDGDALDYAGDELAWEWREATRMRVQDAFEFCLTSTRGGSGTTGTAGLRWSSVSSNAVRGAFGYKNRQHMGRHRRHRSGKDKELSNEKSEFGAEDVASDEGFESIEKVLAAVGFPGTASPSRRGVLSEDLFAAPASFVGREPQKQEYPTIEPLRYHHDEPGPSTGMFTGLEPPKMAKRSSKDKIPGSSTIAGEVPLLSLPYPFSKPGSGQVSSNDLVLFPIGAKLNSQKSQGSDKAKTSKSGTSTSKSTSGGSGSTSGSREEEIEEEEEDDDDDDDDEDEEGDDFGSEEPSEPASGSMSSLGHPISPSRHPFGTRRPGGAGHRRTPSGVSSGTSGAAVSGGSHAHSHSVSSSHGNKSVMGASVLSQSTSNKDSTDSESGVVERRGLNHGSSPLSGGGVIPMPPRHPHPQGQGRGRSGTSSSTVAAAAAALAGVRALHTAPVAFPTVHQQRRRADSGRGIMIDPVVLYGSDIEGQHEFNDDDLNELPDDDDDPMADDDNEDEQAELEDHVGLLGVPSSPLASHSGVSLSGQSSSSGSLEARSRSRTHSSFSIHSSRSRHSSTRARSRSRTHSSHGPSVRERASSLGTSMRSLMRNTTASMTQLDLIMRGAAGPGLGVGGSRPRSRVNSSMARLEEDDHEMLSTASAIPAATEEMDERRVSGESTGNGSHDGSAEVAVSSLMMGRLRPEFEEGYSSSGGTHSRSGSEMSGENYTFGRPVLFMRPVQEQQDQPQDLVEADEDEDEIVLMERSNRGPLNRSVPTLSMTTDPGEGGEPKSFVSDSIYSQPTSEATASPGSGATPIPIHRSLSGSPTSFESDNSGEHSPERQGLAVPWNHAQQQQVQRLLAPPLQPWEQAATTSSGGSSALAYISTAAESSVTSAPAMGSTTTSDSSGPHTGGGAGEVRLSEVGGMVERNEEDMGDGASGRVV
jgi:hypothetical protein